MTDPRLVDEPVDLPVLRSERVYEGAVWDVYKDSVDLGGAGVVERDYVRHRGAVAALALDDEDRVLLVRQYRHPVRALCWELPAGLRDVAGEPRVDTAARELIEETGHEARTWFELVDLQTTPGGSSEELTVFLARGITPVTERDFEPEGEEIGMDVAWFAFHDVVDAVLEGRVHNPSLVTGVLAAAVHRSNGWSSLRPVD